MNQNIFLKNEEKFWRKKNKEGTGKEPNALMWWGWNVLVLGASGKETYNFRELLNIKRLCKAYHRKSNGPHWEHVMMIWYCLHRWNLPRRSEFSHRRRLVGRENCSHWQSPIDCFLIPTKKNVSLAFKTSGNERKRIRCNFLILYTTKKSCNCYLG